MSAVSPEDAPELAKFMCHSVQQQQGTYNDMITTSKSVRMSRIVQKILTDSPFEINDFDEATLGKLSCTSDNLTLIHDWTE